ncbi:hypothetical protein F443_05754, partial [Phytophthora nicotianae P1569]
LTPTEAWYRDLLSRVRKGDSEFKSETSSGWCSYRNIRRSLSAVRALVMHVEWGVRTDLLSPRAMKINPSTRQIQ